MTIGILRETAVAAIHRRRNFDTARAAVGSIGHDSSALFN
jgi:hypothetical protein